MRFVTKVTSVSGADQFKVCDDQEAANSHWSKLVDRAVSRVQTVNAPIHAFMYEVDETDAKKARQAVVEGRGRQVKMVVVRPPRRLTGKVKTSGPGVVDAKALARAEKIIEEAGSDYPRWAREDIVAMEVLLASLRDDAADPKDRLAGIFSLSYRMKGHGGTFGYGLMTLIADDLCQIIDAMEEVRRGQIDAIQVHVDAMKFVLAKALVGKGGEAGERIMAGLRKVTDKALGQTPS